MDASYRHCEDLVRAADKDRYLATLFAPADKRGPLFALYAFNLEIAGVRDRVREPMAGEIRLQWWRDVLNGERSGEAAANPVAAALRDTVARFSLPTQRLLDLIEAHAFDLYDDPMPTLRRARRLRAPTSRRPSSIWRRGSAAGRRSTRASGRGSPMASQRCCAPSRCRPRGASSSFRSRHWKAVRIPTRYSPGKPRRGSSMGSACCARAQAEHLAAFEAALPRVPAAAMPAFLPVALVAGYLAAMERPGYDPFKTAVEVPQWRRQWALWRAARRYSRLMRG